MGNDRPLSDEFKRGFGALTDNDVRPAGIGKAGQPVVLARGLLARERGAKEFPAEGGDRPVAH